MSDPYDTHDPENTPDDDGWDGNYPGQDDEDESCVDCGEPADPNPWHDDDLCYDCQQERERDWEDELETRRFLNDWINRGG